jgi:hypothetical protein
MLDASLKRDAAATGEIYKNLRSPKATNYRVLCNVAAHTSLSLECEFIGLPVVLVTSFLNFNLARHPAEPINVCLLANKSVSQQYPQVAKIISRRTCDHRIAQRMEKRIGIEVRERLLR